MDRQYDFFERLPEGSLRWRGSVMGLKDAIVELEELSEVLVQRIFYPLHGDPGDC
jgi:hypothetical protein